MTTDDGGKAAVGEGAGESPFAIPAKCPYCKQPDKNWLDADLMRGKRNGGTEYHCYAGYCLD